MLKVLVDERAFDQRSHHLKQLVESRDDGLEEKRRVRWKGEKEGREWETKKG